MKNYIVNIFSQDDYGVINFDDEMGDKALVEALADNIKSGDGDGFEREVVDEGFSDDFLMGFKFAKDNLEDYDNSKHNTYRAYSI